MSDPANARKDTDDNLDAIIETASRLKANSHGLRDDYLHSLAQWTEHVADLLHKADKIVTDLKANPDNPNAGAGLGSGLSSPSNQEQFIFLARGSSTPN